MFQRARVGGKDVDHITLTSFFSQIKPKSEENQKSNQINHILRYRTSALFSYRNVTATILNVCTNAKIKQRNYKHADKKNVQSYAGNNGFISTYHF